jgi:GNAT superfamily N-acetyltransferase
MLSLERDDLHRYSDVLRSRAGALVTVRFATPEDAEALQSYFRNLSVRSRYNRLMGAASELPASQLDQFTHLSDNGRFSVVATISERGTETIVGEARYAYDEQSGSFEFGLSVDDRLQGQGIGGALLANLECRAAALGADYLTGDTLRSNDVMLSVARKAGFAFAPTPGDWKQVRFEKHIAAAKPDMVCASWRLASAHRAAASVAAMH